MTKILAIISTHGNELLGPNVLSYMLNKRSELLEYVDFMVANPRAYSQNVRYVESDLNRSYGSDLDTYEAREDKVSRDFINASAIKDVLVVEPLNDITTVAPHFVAYEVSNSHLNVDLYERICTDIRKYLDGKVSDQEHTFYKMIGKILPEEVQADSGLENFVYSNTLGAIPSFLGEEAYRQDGTYAGFKLEKFIY